VPLLRRTAHRK